MSKNKYKGSFVKDKIQSESTYQKLKDLGNKKEDKEYISEWTLGLVLGLVIGFILGAYFSTI